MARKAVIAVCAVLLAACSEPATEQDRTDLIGVWDPTDNSGHLIEFKKDGDFDFLPEPGYILEQKWSLPSRGSVTFTPYAGAGPTTCAYAIKDKQLTIGDGSATCFRATQYQVDLPTKFQRKS